MGQPIRMVGPRSGSARIPLTQKAPFETGLFVFGTILLTRPSSSTVISEPHLDAQQVLATVRTMSAPKRQF
jgi:hypothetical protein